MKTDHLAALRDGKTLRFRQLLALTLQLSVPAILSQISSILMQYIDAGMLGRLGAVDSAAIGLVSSSTWLFGGVTSAIATGFTVQVAQYIGAKQEADARRIVRQGLAVSLGFSLLTGALACGLSGALPVWLGGEPAVCRGASTYFLVYGLTIPFQQCANISGGMLQCSGNVKVPSLIHVLMCLLDVVFNRLLIFPGRELRLAGLRLWLPGADLGLLGAALGTMLAMVCGSGLMLWFLLFRSASLRLRRGEKLELRGSELRRAVRIALPVGFESLVTSGAQVVSTRIVAPLGTIAIAANAFSVTAESLCYMPGYGIGAAATTLVGQSIGAGRQELSRKLGWITTGLGMAVMGVTGALLYAFAPEMIGLLSPEPEIRALGAAILRIEAFAEPLYGASIVAAYAFRGAGDTLIPSCMNLFSMWVVRLPLAALLSRRMGLKGVWIAMCLELCFRGTIFLVRLAGKRWLQSGKQTKKPILK